MRRREANEEGGGQKAEAGEHTATDGRTETSSRQRILTDLESGWTPIDELNGSLLLDGSNSRGDIFWNDISSVKKTTRHELSVSWVTLKGREVTKKKDISPEFFASA